MTGLLTDAERARVAAAVREAETRSAGEIVCVIARSAGEYRAVPFAWAAVVALSIPWVLAQLTDWSATSIYLAQLIGFILAGLIFSIQPVRMALVPGPMKRARAARLAEAQFLSHDLSNTRQRTGVLIFVSVAERYAAVLPDTGIATKVDDRVWRDAIERLTDGLKRGDPGGGLVGAVTLCGEVLAETFPPGALDRNELPDHVIEI